MQYAIGIDLGGTNVAAGIVDETYALIAQESIPTGASRPWQDVAADMAALALRLCGTCGLEQEDCAGIGVGSPGTCDSASGHVVYSNNLGWEHVPLADELTRLTSLPCRVSNDANCAVLGEAVAGAAKGCSDVVLITLGTGVGSGILVHGELMEGTNGAGAEMGHTALVCGGEPCTCGRRGCAESYVSATALVRQAREAARLCPQSLLNRPQLQAKDVYDARDAGDETAASVIARYEAYLGEMATDVVNLFRPQVLLIGGGISGQGAALTEPLNRYVQEHGFGGGRSFITRVETARLGNQAGIIGAAALWLHSRDDGPLLLRPAFKDYLWGGNRLKRDFGKQTDMTPLAESWELSCHPDGPSVIENGPWAGKTLQAYLRAYPKRLCAGADAKTEFPLLIKLIDAAQPLSVQVHPDDEYARREENSLGKTEMWVVVDAAPDAGIYYGFRENITLEQMEEAIRTNTLTDRLNWVPAKPGDVFFIPAGTVHAIGAGLLIAEVQQSSNLTYRVYDYGRVGADGKPRALHIRKALDVALREPPVHAVGPTEPERPVRGGSIQTLVHCDRFEVSRLTVCGLMEGEVGTESFHALLCLDGEGAILCGAQSVPLCRGQSAFLPAGMGAYRLAGEMKLLRTTL